MKSKETLSPTIIIKNSETRWAAIDRDNNVLAEGKTIEEADEKAAKVAKKYLIEFESGERPPIMSAGYSLMFVPKSGVAQYFEENTTASELNLPDVMCATPLYELIEKLNCATLLEEKNPEKSIMYYGRLCQHDDGYLCEHRLQFIMDFIQKNYT